MSLGCPWAPDHERVRRLTHSWLDQQPLADQGTKKTTEPAGLCLPQEVAKTQRVLLKFELY
jgi:hypothetical protein